jgi:hypothetical protein
MTVASTSIAARRSLEEQGGLSAGCQQVMLWLFKQPEGQSFTRAEIAQGAGMKLQTVCARVRDLLDEERPRIEEVGTRDCRVNGGPSKTIRPTQPKAAAQPSTATARGVPSQEGARQGEVAPAAPGSALDIARTRAAQALANRQAMPTVTAFVDELRKHFPDAKVTYATEGERSFGRPGPRGVRASDSSPGMDAKLKEKVKDRMRRAA